MSNIKPMNIAEEHIILEELGNPIKVLVKNSKRAKNIGIRINHNRPELIVPFGKYKKAHNFLLSKEKWVRSKLIDIVIPENRIKILGQEYEIEYQKSLRRWASIYSHTLIIESPSEKYEAILMEFLTNLLIGEIESILREIEKQSGVYSKGIKIMNNKNRWGSCSSEKILSFHWRLIFVIPEVLRYIIIHELCHIRVMNHSPKFWALVEKFDPNYRINKKWLKSNSTIIHSYLPNIQFKKNV